MTEAEAIAEFNPVRAAKVTIFDKRVQSLKLTWVQAFEQQETAPQTKSALSLVTQTFISQKR